MILFFWDSLTLPARQQRESALWMMNLLDLKLGSLNNLGPVTEDKIVSKLRTGKPHRSNEVLTTASKWCYFFIFSKQVKPLDFNSYLPVLHSAVIPLKGVIMITNHSENLIIFSHALATTLKILEIARQLPVFCQLPACRRPQLAFVLYSN